MILNFIYACFFNFVGIFRHVGGCPINVQSMTVIEDLKLTLLAHEFVFWYNVTPPFLIDGNDDNKFVSSSLYTSFEGIKLAWVPMVEVMKYAMPCMWLCMAIFCVFLTWKEIISANIHFSVISAFYDWVFVEYWHLIASPERFKIFQEIVFL